MKAISTITLITAFVSMAAFETGFTNWRIEDSKFNISFSTNGVSGIFKKFTGTIVFDEQNLNAAKFDVSVDVHSINTGNGMQNRHAKGSDWFEADRYPEIIFSSKKIVKSGAGYQVSGDLRMHGITKPVLIPFTFRKTPGGGTFDGTFAVNRNDYRIGEPGGQVGDIIKLNISVPVLKK